MVVLVTGGAGFIGSALVRRLVRDTDRTVVNVDRLTYAGNLDSIADLMADPRHVFVRADVSDHAAMLSLLLEHRPDAVIHLAAESHVDRSIDGPAAFVRTNLVGTFAMLEAARTLLESSGSDRRGRFRFLHVSTDEVFGALGPEGRFDERTAYDPSSPYSATKAGSDHLVRAWHRTYGLPVLLSNCGNNYGPRQFPEKLVPLSIAKALAGERIPVYGTGENVRDWIHVDDHVDALLTILERGTPGESYLVGGEGERTNLEVVTAVCRHLDDLRPASGGRPHESLIELVADRPGHDWRYAIDPSKIRDELGWVPRTTFESGLRRTVDWYLANAEWVDRVRSDRYRGERLGLAAGGSGGSTPDAQPSAPSRTRTRVVH